MTESSSGLVAEISGLGKSYGRHLALADLDLEIRRGEILGFLGPNGAGKTTTIRILLGLLRPSAGTARVFGLDSWADSVAVRRRLGYLAGDARFYEAMTGRALLRMLARLRGAGSRGDELAERLGLDLDRRIKSYSKGMRQKLGLIQALMHQPELAILDEPTSALDPLVQNEVYRLLGEIRDAGRSVFLSSHVLPEVQKVCDRVAIVRSGRLVTVTTVTELRGVDLRRLTVRVSEPAAARTALEAAGITGIAFSREGDELRATVRDVDLVVKVLARFEVQSLSLEPLTLEDSFFELYREPDITGDPQASPEVSK